MLTKEQYRARTKTVTRRIGWSNVKPGEVLNGCEKCQGLRKGERIIVMGQHCVISSQWESLRRLIDEPEYGQEEVVKEGFPEMTPVEFVAFFCGSHKDCTPETLVNRIEFEYV